MIVDTSALIAVLLNEPHAKAVAEALARANTLSMSTVNLCETLVIAADRRRIAPEAVLALLEPFAIDFTPPDRDCAALAAAARLRFPLNFGDCFAYALARLARAPILTLDDDFEKTDAKIVNPRARAR